MARPRPTPTHLKVLRGNPGHQKINKDEIEPAILPEIPEPPDFLTGYAFEEWERIVAELYRLRLLSVVDLHPLAAYCQAYDCWRTAIEALKKMGERDAITSALMIRNHNNAPIQNPLFLTARQSASDMVRYAAEFGFTPAARARIAGGINADAAQPSKFAGLLAS
jgi:P27 family predicted phage terminase small subunit